MNMNEIRKKMLKDAGSMERFLEYRSRARWNYKHNYPERRDLSEYVRRHRISKKHRDTQIWMCPGHHKGFHKDIRVLFDKYFGANVEGQSVSYFIDRLFVG